MLYKYHKFIKIIEAENNTEVYNEWCRFISGTNYIEYVFSSWVEDNPIVDRIINAKLWKLISE